jgi:hypothetical protein
MGCNSEYLQASNREQELQRAAQLLVYVHEQSALEPPEWAKKEAKNIYASDDRSVTELCAFLQGMEPVAREQLVYNAKCKTARDLADWWETHQAADRKREERERKEAEQAQLRASAIGKLSDEERKALGL